MQELHTEMACPVCYRGPGQKCRGRISGKVYAHYQHLNGKLESFPVALLRKERALLSGFANQEPDREKADRSREWSAYEGEPNKRRSWDGVPNDSYHYADHDKPRSRGVVSVGGLLEIASTSASAFRRR